MPSRVSIKKIEGLKELDAALGQFSKSTGRGVLKRALVRAGEPIADAARAFAPFESGELKDSIQVSSRIKNTIGNAEFSAAMQAGLGIQAARSALRTARRNEKGSFAEVHVGPAQAKTKDDAIKRIVQEFGSSRQAAQPYMRPAWDSKQGEALDNVKIELAKEITKTAARIAKKKAKGKK